MHKLTLIYCLFLVFSSPILAQKSIVKGNISDTSEKKNLSLSVISVLRKTDSVLVGFTRSDKAGNFQISNLPQGNMIIHVTHPSYADYADQVELKENAVTDLGKIFMILKSQLLQEVIVTNSGAIKIKGDTIEYKVDSMFMKAGATVEDMLKKLPGIQVDKNGRITAQGEAVQKVLVDGEEFFSDDPTIVTRNMLSDAIDKVQVYDKKSDQAAFTGIDDGQKIKTLDLKLKAEKKKGYFGKLELGTDFKKYWNNSGMLNAFQGKRKLALFGIMSNTGKTGLDWNESMNYGASNIDMGVGDGGGMYVNFGGGDEFDGGSFYGEGLPKGWNGGGLYSNKWNEDKISFNGSYQYRKLNTAANGTTNSKYILPDTLYYLNSNGNTFNSRMRHSVNSIFEVQLDSSSSLKFTGQGNVGKTFNINRTFSEAVNEEGKFVNNSDRRIHSEADAKVFSSSLLYRKKFKKTGRTVSMNFSQNYNHTDSDGFLNSEYNFFDENGVQESTTNTDQEKVKQNTRSVINTRIVYTEPLSKRAILEFSYGLNNNNGKSNITTLEKMLPGSPKYENVIDSLSNDYSLNVLTNLAGINYRFTKVKKINLSFGGNVSKADYTRTDLKTHTGFAYSFINFYPQANLMLTFGQRGSLSFNYYGNTQAPSIDQIQPIRDNTDELNQRVGNPNLKQAFRQRFTVYYNNSKFLSERWMYTNFTFAPVYNDFSNINYVAPNGARISQPVNVQGNYNMYGYFNYSKSFKKPRIRLSFFSNINKNRNTNYVNETKNLNNSYNFSVGTRFSYEKEKKFDIGITPRITRSYSRSSIRPDITTKYWTQDHNADLTIFLPWKLEFNTDINVSIRQKTDAFPDNNNATRWNARLDKKILKNSTGILRFAAFDILDQNIGFQRDVSSNFISERTYDTFRRYFMLSFIWNFSKNGKPQSW